MIASKIVIDNQAGVGSQQAGLLVDFARKRRPEETPFSVPSGWHWLRIRFKYKICASFPPPRQRRTPQSPYPSYRTKLNNSLPTSSNKTKHKHPSHPTPNKSSPGIIVPPNPIDYTSIPEELEARIDARVDHFRQQRRQGLQDQIHIRVLVLLILELDLWKHHVARILLRV